MEQDQQVAQRSKQKSNKDLIIQRKNFQNDMSLAIQKTNKKIMSWMKPAAFSESEKVRTFDDFYSLPIIGTNQGLSLPSTNGEENSSTENINSLKNLDSQIMSRKNFKHNGNVSSSMRNAQTLLQASANDSSSMKSLKNKLRTDNLNKLRNSAALQSNDNGKNKFRKGTTKSNSSRDSEATNFNKAYEETGDEEDEEIENLGSQKSKKKSTKGGFPFGTSKINKKRK